jgi:AAA family ATP:ADP antiporter
MCGWRGRQHNSTALVGDALASVDSDTRAAVVTATLTSMAMIGYQMAAKATRDALFLSSFDVSALPAMVMTSAALSVLLALAASRMMTSFGPMRLVPVLFASSAVLLLVEWGLIDQFRRPVAVIVYLHYGALGALLVSGFWSIVNERFDPRTAKRQVSRIAAGATMGGLLGGILAERVAVLLSMTAMLPILAGLHLFCAWMVLRLGLGTPTPSKTRHHSSDEAERSGLKIISETPYLRNLVAFVVLATMAEVFIDYVFKARASLAFGGGEDLLRLFAVFYTVVALFTVVVQSTLGRITLQRLGLARTVALLPSVLTLGGVGALAVPGLMSAAIARGTEAVLRNSLYRPGYELLFSPIGQRQKRATKTIVDVGFVRLGDVAGAAIVQLTLFVAVGTGFVALLGLTVGCSVLAVVVAFRLHRGYVQTLERSLVSRAEMLEIDEFDDAITRTVMLQTVGTLGLAPSLDQAVKTSTPVEQASGVGSVGTGVTSSTTVPVQDPLVARIVELRSRDAERVRAALSNSPLTLALVPHVLPLLAWDEVVSEAIKALRDVAPTVTGQLVDRLIDPVEEFAVRRRIPLVLAACPTERAFEGVFRGLEDKRFEVRHRCGRSLSRLHELNSDLRIDRDRVVEAVLREVDVERGVWESHRLIDRMEDEEWSPVLDEMLGDRADRSLEHVFTILALILPRQPLKIAFRGLHTNDAVLRGTALEYLETALPSEVKAQLWPFLDDKSHKQDHRRSSAQVLASLLESNASIAINLDELRRKSKSQ